MNNYTRFALVILALTVMWEQYEINELRASRFPTVMQMTSGPPRQFQAPPGASAYMQSGVPSQNWVATPD